MNHRIWNARYDQLVAFVKKYKILPDHSDGVLGRWVYNQQWRGRICVSERVKQLEKIPGWTWKHISDHAKNWEEKYHELMQFEKEHNRFPFPQERLYTWMRTQRVGYRNSTLSEKRIKKLEKIKNWVWEWTRRPPLNGLPNRQKDVKKRRRMAEFKAKGWSVSKIAEFCGCSRQNVYQLLDGAGVRPYTKRSIT